MKFKRKIAPEIKPRQNFITKKRLREDEIDFDNLRSYRLDRVRKELVKNNLEACILFDPVNVRYALDTVNMSVYNMHNLTRYCFVPVNGPTILYEYFNCEILSKYISKPHTLKLTSIVFNRTGCNSPKLAILFLPSLKEDDLPG